MFPLLPAVIAAGVANIVAAADKVDKVQAKKAIPRVEFAGNEMPKKKTNQLLENIVKEAATIGAAQALAAAPKSGQFAMNGKGKKALQNIVTTRNAPAARSKRVNTSNRPRVRSTRGGIVVSHKEMVGSLISSGTTLTFQANSYTINPGKPVGFPWLSTLACNFDKYKMHSLKVHLVSSQPTSTAGRIGVGVDYDSTDVLPGDRVDFFNLTHHAECAAWDSVTLDVPLKPEEKFINSHTITDSKLIDMGMIVVMSDQIVATSSVLADVIFEYHVELLEPQQAPLFTQVFNSNNSLLTDSFNTSVGPAIVTRVSSTSATVVEFLFPPGCYLFSFALNDAAAGSPGLAVAVHSSAGRYANMSSTTDKAVIGCVRSIAPDSSIRLTYSVVNVSALEFNTLCFTRVSPVVFNLLGGGTTGFNTALPTY